MSHKNIIRTTALYTGVFIMSFLIGYLVLAFDEPQTAPPDCDSALNEGCNLPINVGSSNQAKSGNLGVNADGNDIGFVVDDNGLPDKGFVGIGTLTPAYKLDVDGKVNAAEFCIAGADCITSWPSGGTGLWNQSGSDIYYDAGNVGIGTTSPSSILEIEGDSPILKINDRENVRSRIYFKENGTNKWGIGGTSSVGGNKFQILELGVSPRITILSKAGQEGYVGIGTEDPQARLNVCDGDGVFCSDVGIGIYDPEAKLDVRGNVRIGDGDNTAAQENKVLCWRDDNKIGYCSSGVGGTGGCTCNPIN